MATQPDPDTIEPDAPPEIPADSPPAEEPMEDPPGIEPVQPDFDRPDRSPVEAPPPPD